MNEEGNYKVYGLTCIDLINYENLIKIGMCENYKNRVSTYITGYPYNIPTLKFVILCQTQDEANDIEDLLKYELYEYSTIQKEIHNNGGTEWFNIENFNKNIKKILQTEGYTNKILIDDELIEFETNEKRKFREYNQKEKNKKELYKKNKIIRVKNAFNNFKNNKTESNKRKKPYKHQQDVIDKIENFYENNNIGKLLWACGLGKSLESMFIIKKLNFKKILYGVPSIVLQQQITDDILNIFPNKNNILFIGGENYNKINKTDSIKYIETFINERTCEPRFIITTYSSCGLLSKNNIKFDFKIGDEAHRLVNPDKDNGFILFHKIESEKTLFMTATEKIIYSDKDNLYSMDNKKYFGECIDEKSIKWAIDNRRITDYNLLLLKNVEEDLNNIIKKINIDIDNKDLFLSAYMTLKSFEKYNNLSHILIYTNNTHNAELVDKYIKIIINKNMIKNIDNNLYHNLYHNSLHSNKNFNLEKELSLFKNSKYGIISCVYLFGEGFNLPELNGVCIADNMYSIIRIIQYLLRSNRLNKNVLRKISYYILPYIDYDDYEEKNKSYQKIKNIISQIRDEDDILEQKISLLTLKSNKKDVDDDESDCYESDDDFIDDDIDELQKIKIRLRYSKALKSKNTEEQDEYDYVKMINNELEIKSKPEYIQSKNKHQHFINEAEDYFTKNGVWKNWYDFMNVDTYVFIQDKDEFVKFCIEKKINKNNYNENCKIYNCLPNIPDYFYKDFTFSQLNNSVRKRRKL